MSRDLKKLYLYEASKMSREMNGLALNRKLLHSIYSEFIINREKSVQTYSNKKEQCAAIGLILSNHEYSMYNFKQLQPIIIDLVEDDIHLIGPILDALVNDFYATTFPTQTADILNRVHKNIAKSLMNFSDTDLNTSNHSMLSDAGSVINCLSKAKDKIKFESNMNLNIKKLMLNFENCLKDFESQNLSNDKVSTSSTPSDKSMSLRDLSDQLKLFETRIYKYSICLKLISNMVLLSNDYNRELVYDISRCVVRLLSIFHDNLFTRTVVENKMKKNFFTKNFVNDLLTIFGLFNFFDYKIICRDASMSNVMQENLKMLKTFNESMYDLASKHDKMDLMQLIDYNFCLLNLDIECNKPMNDLFDNVRSFDNLVKIFSNLNQVNFFFVYFL